MEPSEADALMWTPQGPRSAQFDDIYFSAADGLAEARVVFLEGCGLPQAWTARRRFVVGELGFGTGLNIAALLELWRRTRPPQGRLSIFSVEAYPLSKAQAARALSAWPDLDEAAGALLDAWPDGRRGFHRLDLNRFGATLDLWIGDVAEGLGAWQGAADAWFLDGFAPSRNPQMWSQEVLDRVCARARSGARLATFTVAGAVRRGLQQAGARVEKKPGFGAKRERLEAWIDSDRPADASRLALSARPRIAIVGAGIAGAALARAFQREGAQVLVIDQGGPGAGASGNPSALVTPRLDAGLGVAAELHAQAFARAVRLYARETPDAIVAQGALQLEATPRDAARFAKLAAWQGFAPGAVSIMTAEDVGGRLGEAPSRAALSYGEALVVRPSAVLETWLATTPVRVAEVTGLAASAQGWRLSGPHGETIADVDVVVLAGGPASQRLAGDGPASALMAVRGQASWTSSAHALGGACAWGGYAIPTPAGGVLFGSSHVRNDWGVEVRASDEDHNLSLLAQGRPALAKAISMDPAPLHGRASLRAATPDQMPLAGRLGDRAGLYILSGLGARGFTLAPLLAEHIVAETLGAPSPLHACVTAAIVPARFDRKLDLK
jgi:tRNA 5-methylaminomethyl-2-thiouridine biosynthesis bifunctional protein